ncbi:MAG: hypothetical protein ABSG84_11315 [Acidobacteriaceae bacterium]|jgi:hypothetical protein
MRSAKWMVRVLALLLALLLAPSGGRAQTLTEAAAGTTPPTMEAALHAMAQQAAVIFAGQVIAVRGQDGVDGAAGVVEIEFTVDDAVRGVSGDTYTLREWAGLWTGGDQPLRVGHRFLIFLHAPSVAGLSSPVGGMDGAIPVRGEPAQAELRQGTRLAEDTAPADARTVDLRWVATRVVRPVGYLSQPVHSTTLPGGVHAEAIAAAPAPGTDAGANSQSNNPASGLPIDAAIAPAAQTASYATVMALLQSWEAAGDVAP